MIQFPVKYSQNRSFALMISLTYNLFFMRVIALEMTFHPTPIRSLTKIKDADEEEFPTQSQEA